VNATGAPMKAHHGPIVAENEPDAVCSTISPEAIDPLLRLGTRPYLKPHFTLPRSATLKVPTIGSAQYTRDTRRPTGTTPAWSTPIPLTAA